MRVQRFAKNYVGRDLIVGDIHGHFSKLEAQLDSIGFNERVDRLFSVGDLVDRGPESDRVLEWLAKPWFHPVTGNHEDFAIRWPNGHMVAGHYVQNGGAWNVSNPRDVQLEIAEALKVLPIAIEIETEGGPEITDGGGIVGIVHADCLDSDWDLFTAALKSPDLTGRDMENLEEMAMWSRSRIDAALSGFNTEPVSGVRAMVVGHTPVKKMVKLENVYYVDTGGWLGRDFTLLDAQTLEPVREVA